MKKNTLRSGGTRVHRRKHLSIYGIPITYWYQIDVSYSLNHRILQGCRERTRQFLHSRVIHKARISFVRLTEMLVSFAKHPAFFNRAEFTNREPSLVSKFLKRLYLSRLPSVPSLLSRSFIFSSVFFSLRLNTQIRI